MRSIIAIGALVLSLGPSWAGEMVPDFRLLDVNPNSVRSQVVVSPRNYRLQVSAYYFGEAH